MDFWSRLEQVRERWNVLEHPFYQRWSGGELRRDELAAYAGQYGHAVRALADASDRAAQLSGGHERAELERHAREEAAHVALWDRFTEAAGGDRESQPTEATRACARAWAGARRDRLATLVALYGIESGQPAISQTKLDGLRAHRDRYGVEEGPATVYFELHARLDHEHAAQARALIEPELDGADAGELLAEAEAVLRANWELLDGVEAKP